MSTTNADADNEPERESTRLALDRTWLAHERTLMAWVRTATSMIGFGFTIYKFFELEAVHRERTYGGITPRDFALMMISIGLITLFLATISRRREVKGISKQLRRSRRINGRDSRGIGLGIWNSGFARDCIARLNGRYELLNRLERGRHSGRSRSGSY